MVKVRELLVDSSNISDFQSLVKKKFRLQLKKLARVRRIIKEVRQEKDRALLRLTKELDGADLSKKGILVTDREIKNALKNADRSFLELFQKARQRIEKYACEELCRLQSWSYKDDLGNQLGQVFKPIKRVGFYIPGGRAFYPSTLLMNICPAKIAGVKELVVCTPPGRDGSVIPEILVASSLLEVKEIYRLGGAQAIAALAYGTETVKPVDLIAGPGNIYVTLAKKEVFGEVGVDLLAGPSEIVILADEKAQPDLIAADLLAQAEHDPDSFCALITTSSRLARAVKAELNKQSLTLSRKEIALKALKRNGFLITVSSLEMAIELVNFLAPEHLELMTASAREIAEQIDYCGALFVGESSPVVAGDYLAGPSHTLPTSLTSRFFSPLSVRTFFTHHSIIELSSKGFSELASEMIDFARLEGLEAHAEAIKIRLDKLKK